MFWELIATFIAGFVAAGIVLSIRLVFKKLPKWMVPAAAGLGMMGFGVYSEYDWYQHTATRLPQGVTVVTTYAEPVFYQPWSYYKAPIRRFIAIDKTAVKDTEIPNIKQAQLYFMERRMPAQTLPILIDCANGLQSEFGNIQNFGKTAYTDDLVKNACN